MRELLEADWLRAVFLAPVVTGALLLALAAWSYGSAERELQGNLAHALAGVELNVSPGAISEAQGLVASDMARRDLLQQQNVALMAGGGGLVLIAAGWLGVNFSRYLRNRYPAAARKQEAPS